MTFPEKLKSWRKASGFAQKQAADWLSVSMRTYQRWEAGKGEPAKTCLKCVEEKMEVYVL